MAESIILGLAGNIITKVGSLALQELGLFCGVRGELDKLEDTLSSIKAVLLDAEEQQAKSHAVEKWVSNLKDALYDIDDLFDELSYETLRIQVMGRDNNRRKKCKQVRMFFSKFNQIAFAFKMGHKIKDIRERLQDIDANKNQFGLSTNNMMGKHLDMRNDGLRKARKTGFDIREDEVIGRNDDKKEIIKLLLDSNTNTNQDPAVISIVGMGGLGKTTLAQSVYNDNMVVKHFELKLWVCVSEEFDVETIIKNIVHSATGKKPEPLEMASLQSKLKEKIDGKKYLLVMDDVWNENYEKWVTLRTSLRVGAKGSRILITTRSKNVAKTFDTASSYFLQNLDGGNAWLLFKKLTFLEGSEEKLENSNLVEIGKEIVAKLEGVPLAIRIIGRFLYDNKSKAFWLSFKEKELYQAIEQRHQLKDKLLPILKLSYNNLPSNLKQCFLYCVLFPKDYTIEKDELILLWIAQGFIQPNDKDNLIDIGEDYFMDLLSRSFFQDVTRNKFGDIEACKLHDLMHDLACLMVKNECGSDVSNASTSIHERTHHSSLHSAPGENLGNFLKTLPKARNLRTFLMLHQAYDYVGGIFEKKNYNLLRLRALKLSSMNSSAKFLESESKLKHLRYLSLSESDIEVLPDSITELFNLQTLILENFLKLKELPRDVKNWINLRHLNLFYACSLQFLPDSITHLKNLETLLLRSCNSLKELPRDIKNLIKLKHLDMNAFQSFTHMPKGLGELTNLQTMNLFVVGKGKGGGLSELNGLNELRGELVITELQYCTSVDLQTNAKLLKLKSGLQELVVKWKYDDLCNEPTIDALDDDYERVLECLQPHSNLREIRIEGYKGVKLCSLLSSNSLGCLVRMEIISCTRLQHLPQLDQFPYLKELLLENLPNIEYIGSNDSPSSSTRFPSLEILSIVGTPKLKRWWKKDTTSIESNKSTEGLFPVIKFPCLSELQIGDCPLCILIQLHAPNLKSLAIMDARREDEFEVVPWKNFENISTFQLVRAYMEYLPKGLQHLTALHHLCVSSCKNLKSLPEWIGNLTSLTSLDILNSEKLTSLPEGIRHLHCLQSLKIIECPLLAERCQEETGEDWPKITHIPDVIVL